jgi:L-lactate utilization protein LutC
MQFLKKFFSNKNKNYDKENELDTDELNQLPVDEIFVVNFKKNGGKFFYPENMEELTKELAAILNINNEEKYQFIERAYYHFLKKINIPSKEFKSKKGIIIGGCEYLIAEDGAIMTTSKQLKHYRNDELPQKRVIIATSNQIVRDKRQALEEINKKYEDYPTNIQTISTFKETDDDLNGNSWVETYLFLIEK